MAALDTLRSQADKIRYACEQVPVPTTAAVRDWLTAYGVRPARSHTSNVVNAWRREKGLGSTGELTRLTPELLAELDAIATARPSPVGTSQHPANTPGVLPNALQHQPDLAQQRSNTVDDVVQHRSVLLEELANATHQESREDLDVPVLGTDTMPNTEPAPQDALQHLRTRPAAVRADQQKRVSTWVFVLGALVGLVVSVDTSWRFFGEKLGVSNIPERVAMFAGMEIVLVACGIAMFEGVRRHGGTPGPARWLAWALCGASAYAALVLSGPFLGTARVLFGPVLSVIALHFALGVELRARGHRRHGAVARIGRELRERFLSRFGLADDNRDALTRTRDRAARNVARLALAPRWTPLRQARLDRNLRKSNAAHDPAARARMLAELAAIRHARDLRTLTQRSPWTTH